MKASELLSIPELAADLGRLRIGDTIQIRRRPRFDPQRIRLHPNYRVEYDTFTRVAEDRFVRNYRPRINTRFDPRRLPC